MNAVIEPSIRPARRVCAARIITVAALCGWALGCEQPKASPPALSSPPPAEQPPQATQQPKSATKAPYSLALPPEFERVDPARVNPDADQVWRTADGQVVVMVISVEVPASSGARMADVEELRQHALALMRHNLEGFTLIERAEREIAGQRALTARAVARVGALAHTYELAYMERAGWRYQLIAFSQSGAQDQLKARVDQVVGAWRFEPAQSP